MSKVKLYGVAASRSIRCVWMLEELGIEWEHDPIRTDDPRIKQPAYLAINPNGRIPTLTVDGFAIFESLAINLYLAQRFPGPLSMGTGELNALALQWSMWAQTDIDPLATQYALNTVLRPPAERDAAAAADAFNKIKKSLGVLETVLHGREWLLDGRFTVADLNVAATLSRALAWEMTEHPGVKAWLTRCWARPAGIRARRLRGDPV